MKIDSSEIRWSALSVADDTGRVFVWRDNIYRGIYEKKTDQIRKLIECGLLDELIRERLIPKTYVTDLSAEGFELILRHEKIHTLTYPYEWSFEMLKDAALTVLKVNKISKKYGYQTKDCHAFNVLFEGTNAMYVDIGSFVEVDKSFKGWICHQEFLKSYEYLLRIAKSNDYHWVKQLFISDSVISHESFLLYRYSLLRIFNLNFIQKMIGGYFLFKNLHSMDPSQYGWALQRVAPLITFLKKFKLLPFQRVNLNRIERRIKKIKKLSYKTAWGDYHNEFKTKPETFKRFSRIIEVLKQYDIRTTFEVAGNQGFFSKMMLDHLNLEYAYCSDYDENAVDLMYKVNKGNERLSPALMNFLFPNITSFTVHPSDRLKSDAVVALAVTHHILLTQQLKIDFVFSSLSQFTRKYIAVEFMPLGLWDGKSGHPIPDWYTLEWFRDHFNNHFDLLLEEQLEANRILLFGVKKNKE